MKHVQSLFRIRFGGFFGGGGFGGPDPDPISAIEIISLLIDVRVDADFVSKDYIISSLELIAPQNPSRAHSSY